jgi:hypothetical protein
MECQYCKKTFSNKSNLNYHQARARYCLNIQNKKPDNIYKCCHCEKEFTVKDNYDTHIAKHTISPVFQAEERLRIQTEEHAKELERVHTEYANKIEKYEQEIARMQSENTIKIEEYKKEIQEYKQTVERLANKAISKPTKTYNNTMNNIITTDMLTPIDRDHMEIFKMRLTPKIFTSSLYTGGAGIAKWLLDYPLKNNIYCTDTSRQKFKYRVGNKITSDLKGRNIWKLSLDTYYEEMTKFIDNEIRNIERNETLDFETKTKIAMDYMETKSDLSNFHRYEIHTATEEDFSSFLTTNTHTKETLLIFFEQEKERRALEEENYRAMSAIGQEKSRKLFNDHFRIENGNAIPLENDSSSED